MKAFVFTDESLREQAGRFVWLELNVDRAENATARARLGAQALPTYFVLEPESERIVLRWVGGTTAAQLGDLLDHARKNAADLRAGTDSLARDVATNRPNDLLVRADLLYGEGRGEEAAALYQRSIEAAPEDWPAYSRAVEALLLAWLLDGSCDQASPFARAVYPRLATTPSVAIVASVGLDCALELPEDDPSKAALVSYFEDACRRATEDLTIPMAADDRSGLYISMLTARKASEDSVGARSVAESWLAFLDTEADNAPTPEARTVFDSHRLSACIELGVPERAVAFLERSRSDFPEDYNPPARLAVAYREMKRWDEALAQSERAVSLAYGPRLVSLLRSRADLFLSKGDAEAARAVLEKAIETAESLPEGQRSERTIASLREKLDLLTVGATG